MELASAKMIGAGLACIALVGAGIGIGNVFGSLINSLARNPAAQVTPFAFLGFALAEATGLFGLAIAFLITFVLLYVLMVKLGLPSIDRALKARRTRIEDDLDKARQMKAEAEAVIAAYERALGEARQ